MKKMLFAAIVLGLPVSSFASFHIIHIEEVYTNSDGTIQFIELQADSGSQTQLQQAELIAQDATGATSTTILDITTSLPGLGSGETALLATAAAQTALGFSADYTIPDGSIPYPDGRVVFQQDGALLIVSALAYGSYSGSNGSFGTPAAALPTDETNSLTHTAFTANNSTSYVSAANSPTNSSGQSGTLSPSSGVSDWWLF